MDRNNNLQTKYVKYLLVALRKESVDKNCVKLLLQLMKVLSLSARRAWIEMWVLRKVPILGIKVALRKESVDRNIVEIHPDGRLTCCRSPQGERG